MTPDMKLAGEAAFTAVRRAALMETASKVSLTVASKLSFTYILMLFGVSISLINGKPVDDFNNFVSVSRSFVISPMGNDGITREAYKRNIGIKKVSLPNVQHTVARSFMSSFFHVMDHTTNPLARQRQYLKGHMLTREQKLHFYAIVLAELGPKATVEDMAMLIETAYNRGITESDNHIKQNLTYAYYQPLRKWRTKRYYVKIKVGKGKKRKTKTVRRTKKIKTQGWRNYQRYLSRLKTNADLFAKVDKAHDICLAGSNFSKMGTQNASAKVAASARRTQTVTAVTSTGETISRKDLLPYKKKHGEATIIKTQQWVKATTLELKKFEALASTQSKPKKINALAKYHTAVKVAKKYLRSIAVGGAAGEGEGSSGVVMKEHGYDAIDNLNGPTAIKAANALREYNRYARQNDLPTAKLISAARFGHLHGMPGGFNNKTKSQHSAGMAIDLTFGKGLDHANTSTEMTIFSKFGKFYGLYWGKEIYGTHEGHHWQSHPGKKNVFEKSFSDGNLSEDEIFKILHADPFNPNGALVTEQINELMLSTSGNRA